MRTDRKPRTPPPPLDQPALERLALRYVERFATSQGRLEDYLRRKLRERGAEGEVDAGAIAERMVERGYVDDAAYADARAGAMARRGLGVRRVVQTLQQAGIDPGRIAAATAAASALKAALVFARRRRIGPYGADEVDPRERERRIAAMVRAGHDYRLARRIAMARPGEDFDDGENV